MGAELHQNTTRRDIGLIDGFTIAPGEKRTLPWHVASHPLTKAHVKLGDLAVVVPAAAAEALALEPEKTEPAKRGKSNKRTVKALDKAEAAGPEAVEPEAPEDGEE